MGSVVEKLKVPRAKGKLGAGTRYPFVMKMLPPPTICTLRY